MRRGAALYRAGRFEAAATFARRLTAEGAFNRGNALLMQGKYAEAIAAYDEAVRRRPGWIAPEVNRRIAAARRDRLASAGGERPGSPPQLKPDGFVFEERPPGKKGEPGEPVPEEGGGNLSEEEMRALWLRRLQTRPRDFLRAKFAYQYAHRGERGSKR